MSGRRFSSSSARRRPARRRSREEARAAQPRPVPVPEQGHVQGQLLRGLRLRRPARGADRGGRPRDPVLGRRAAARVRRLRHRGEQLRSETDVRRRSSVCGRSTGHSSIQLHCTRPKGSSWSALRSGSGRASATRATATSRRTSARCARSSRPASGIRSTSTASSIRVDERRRLLVRRGSRTGCAGPVRVGPGRGRGARVPHTKPAHRRGLHLWKTAARPQPHPLLRPRPGQTPEDVSRSGTAPPRLRQMASRELEAAVGAGPARPRACPSRAGRVDQTASRGNGPSA